MDLNQYYTLTEIGSEAAHFARSLLQSNPMTRACLSILGDELIKQLEFGYFSSGHDIINQGETGKELFFLCTNVVDVLVNNQVVVQMNAPVLLGDKAIVEPKSTRSATIRIAENQICLFIKIPMGLFIRNFRDKRIPDQAFTQETGIFYNMFEAIQKRLFEYTYLQKNLWEEVSTTLEVLNTQLVAKNLETQKPQPWDESIWSQVKTLIAKEVGFNWPPTIPLTAQTFRELLLKVLEKKFPKASFRGEATEYLTKKNLIWRKWLTSIAEGVVRVLPREMLPVNIGEVQLFNPRNYRLRVQGLLRKVEKNFPMKEETQEEEFPKIAHFFGNSDNPNSFDLKRYLQSFEKFYKVPYPCRTQAQIAQQIALVAAKCENEFNSSVAGMQKFQEKVQTMSIDLSAAKKREKTYEEIAEDINVLRRGFSSFNRKVEGLAVKSVGEVSYIEELVPTTMKLIKASGSKQVRAMINKASQNIFNALDVASNQLSMQYMQTSLYFCDASPGFVVPAGELSKHHWIPVSEKILFMQGTKLIGEAKPGMIYGGASWYEKTYSSMDEEKQSYYLKAPDRQENDPIDHTYLFLLIPKDNLPWIRSSNPAPKIMEEVHLPKMQWFINKFLEHIEVAIQEREHYYDQWCKVNRLVSFENSIKEFESKNVAISMNAKQEIAILLTDMVGLTVDPKVLQSSKLLSKMIYNHILQQMKKDSPALPLEERSNRSYTKWRQVLSEIIRLLEPSSQDERTGKSPTPVYEIILKNLEVSLEELGANQFLQHLRLLAPTPVITLKDIYNTFNQHIPTIIAVFQKIQDELEKQLLTVLEEVREYEIKFEEVSDNRPQSDDEQVHVQMTLELIEKLSKILSAHFPALLSA